MARKTSRRKRTGRRDVKSVKSLVPAKRKKPIISFSNSMALRRQVAFEVINTNELTVSQLPQITHLLRNLRNGGVLQAIEYLRGSDAPDAINFLKWYDSIPDTTRALLPIEAFTIPAGITTRRLLELITGACFEQSALATELLVKAAHPDVVKHSIDIALDPESDGIADRKMIHQHMGFLPMPKTSVVNVRGNVDNLTGVDNRNQKSVSVLEIGTVNTKIDRITDRFNEKLGLGDAGRYNGPTMLDEPEDGEGTPTVDVESTEVAD